MARVTGDGKRTGSAQTVSRRAGGGGPLAGVRVVELCWVWSGPLLGQLLGDLGAEVIKCEWYRRYDPYRTRGVERLRGKIPESRRRESSHSFHSLNRNKLGLAVDIKDPDGREVVIDLLCESDLLIENFTVGTLDRLGLGADVLGTLNPDLVALSLSGFGAGSRLESMRAYGLILSSLGGAEADIEADGEFVGSPTFVVSDPNAAVFGLYAAVAGLLRVKRGGGGGAMRGSQLEAIMSLVGLPVDDAAPAWHDLTVLCHDGVYLAVSIRDDAHAPTATDVQSRAGELTSDDLVRWLQDRGVAAAPVLDVPETVDHEVFADLAVRVSAMHPVSGPEELVAAPWRMNGQRAPLRKVAPLLGEGDDYVLSAVIGAGDEEVSRRRQSEPARRTPPLREEAPGVD